MLNYTGQIPRNIIRDTDLVSPVRLIRNKHMSKLFLHPKIAENNSDNLLGKVVSHQGDGCGGGVHAGEGEHHPHSHRLLVGVLRLLGWR